MHFKIWWNTRRSPFLAGVNDSKQRKRWKNRKKLGPPNGHVGDWILTMWIFVWQEVIYAYLSAFAPLSSRGPHSRATFSCKSYSSEFPHAAVSPHTQNNDSEDTTPWSSLFTERIYYASSVGAATETFLTWLLAEYEFDPPKTN